MFIVPQTVVLSDGDRLTDAEMDARYFKGRRRRRTTTTVGGGGSARVWSFEVAAESATSPHLMHRALRDV